MPSHDRRAAGRRRAWGRGPIILKLESLERRALMAANGTLPDLVNSALTTSISVADWSNTVEVQGRVTNQGGSATTAPLDARSPAPTSMAAAAATSRRWRTSTSRAG